MTMMCHLDDVTYYSYRSTKTNVGTSGHLNFIADPRKYITGYYEKIVDITGALSLVFNVLLYWSTFRVSIIVEGFKSQGKTADDEALAHISSLTYKYVLLIEKNIHHIDDGGYRTYNLFIS
jgi:hypothetical protein